MLANRVLAGKDGFDQRLVHNSYEAFTVGIGVRQNASPEQRDAHGLEIARRAHSNIRLIASVVPGKVEAAIAVAAGQGQTAYRCRGLDPGQCLQFLKHLAVKLILLTRSTSRREPDIEYQQMARVETRIHLHE